MSKRKGRRRLKKGQFEIVDERGRHLGHGRRFPGATYYAFDEPPSLETWLALMEAHKGEAAQAFEEISAAEGWDV